MPDAAGIALSAFSESYEQAREKFLIQAESVGADIQSYAHPSSVAAGGTPLALDTAWVGPRDAKHVMVMISGTHGPESYAGAAIQLDWLNSHKAFPSPSMAMLLIHGANPFGWAHCSRTTENNVDLNRNFINHQQPHSPSPLVDRVQSLLSASSAKGPRFMSVVLGLVKLLLRVGITKVVNEISNGQYSHPKGIGFGGNHAEWSNQTLTQLLTDGLKQADQVSIIDWHTGIGDYAEPCFLCFDAPDSEAYQRACNWWGEGVEKSSTNYASGQRPDYQGLLINAARDIAQAAGAKTTSSVIEFGTYANHKMLKGLLIDRWLRCDADDASPESVARLQEQVLRLFYPTDAQWRARVLEQGARIVSQGLAGLSAEHTD